MGSFSPNGWGLYDMLGNVWEFCSDLAQEYPSDSQVDPTGSITGWHRAVRGGSWHRKGSDVALLNVISPTRRSRTSTAASALCGPRIDVHIPPQSSILHVTRDTCSLEKWAIMGAPHHPTAVEGDIPRRILSPIVMSPLACILRLRS